MNNHWKGCTKAPIITKAPILWPPDAKNQLIGKDPDARKDRRQGKRRVTEDEMAGWHHQVNGHELEQVPGHGEGQRRLACCSPWGHKKLDTTEQLYKNSNINNLFMKYDVVIKGLGFGLLC